MFLKDLILELFIHRLHVQGAAVFLNMSNSDFDYLNSQDIITDVMNVTISNPCLFFTCLKSCLNIEFSTEFMRMVRNDKYAILGKDSIIGINDIETIKL